MEQEEEGGQEVAARQQGARSRREEEDVMKEHKVDDARDHAQALRLSPTIMMQIGDLLPYFDPPQ
jgi:hypothetical protein